MSGMRTRAIPRRRWGIAVLLGASVLINYFDRLNLSVAAPQLRTELHMDTLALGFLFSAFNWSYAGLADPFWHFARPRRRHVGRSRRHPALGRGLGHYRHGRRLCRHLHRAPAPRRRRGTRFPAQLQGNRPVVPAQQNAVPGTSMFDGMAKFSQVIGVPLVAVTMVTFGWRGAFWMTSILSFLFFGIFWWRYRDPSADTQLDPVELAYIREGGAAPEGRAEGNTLAMLCPRPAAAAKSGA